MHNNEIKRQYMCNVVCETVWYVDRHIVIFSFLIGLPIILLTSLISCMRPSCLKTRPIQRCFRSVLHDVIFLVCRSTPCPNVKQGDEWGDPSKCENGDTCGYCHTRTEQQFHLEVSLLPFSQRVSSLASVLFPIPQTLCYKLYKRQWERNKLPHWTVLDLSTTKHNTRFSTGIELLCIIHSFIHSLRSTIVESKIKSLRKCPSKSCLCTTYELKSYCLLSWMCE